MPDSDSAFAAQVEAAREKLSSMKQRTSESFAKGSEFVREKAKMIDDKVHNNPWPVVAGVFVCGVLLGFILGRKSSSD